MDSVERGFWCTGRRERIGKEESAIKRGREKEKIVEKS